MITTAVGEVFTVDLPSTPTTGYQWQDPRLPPGLELVDTAFTLPPTTQPGDGGTQHFHFRATKPGRYTLTFELKRPWEQTPLDTRTVEVEVQS